jgi:hypothetical protein
MELQLINIKPFIFRFKNKQFEFVKPYYLMPVDGFRLIKGVVRGSCLCWNIGGGVVTYGKLKSLLWKATLSG